MSETTLTIEELEAKAATVRAARALKNSDLATAKKRRDLAEEVETDSLLDDPANRRIKIDTDPGHPGFIVFRLPKDFEAAKFRHIMWKNAAERGAVEAKAKAGGDLARACVVHPEREAYANLCAAYATVSDAIAKAIMQAADAEAAEEEKS